MADTIVSRAHPAAVWPRDEKSPVWRWVVDGLKTVSKFSSGYHCAKEASRLNELSDEQLAELGIKREEIVTHAFRHHAF